eukprot:gene8908-biopygen6159
MCTCVRMRCGVVRNPGPGAVLQFGASVATAAAAGGCWRQCAAWLRSARSAAVGVHGIGKRLAEEWVLHLPQQRQLLGRAAAQDDLFACGLDAQKLFITFGHLQSGNNVWFYLPRCRRGRSGHHG